MTIPEPMISDREAFQRLLDVHGADRARWPAAERLRFAQLLARDEVARTMLAEAAALDAVLDTAPAVGKERQAIVAARLMSIIGEPPEADGDPQRQRDGRGNPSRQSPAPLVMQPRSQRRPGVRTAPALALLAASLAAGVVIGLSGAAAPALNGIADAVLGASTDSDIELVMASDVLAGGEDTL